MARTWWLFALVVPTLVLDAADGLVARRTKTVTPAGALLDMQVDAGVLLVVIIVLGDHQPATIVSGEGAGHDVPITIIAHDLAVLDRIPGRGWQDGMRPGPDAPVWPMDAFRDRFLSAYGPLCPNCPGRVAGARLSRWRPKERIPFRACC